MSVVSTLFTKQSGSGGPGLGLHLNQQPGRRGCLTCIPIQAGSDIWMNPSSRLNAKRFFCGGLLITKAKSWKPVRPSAMTAGQS